MVKRFLTASEVAELLNVTPDYVNALARAGTLPAYRVGRLWRFAPDELETWIVERRWCQGGAESEERDEADRWLEERLRELGDASQEP